MVSIVTKFHLDPYTGEELGRHQAGAISEGLVNLMPFIYQLHYCLALDSFGIWVLGICALVWTLDCFVAFYLTFPARRQKEEKPGVRLIEAWLEDRHSR
ncbi:MAG: PepSY domain-containing protein [Methylococcales bacterium]